MPRLAIVIQSMGGGGVTTVGKFLLGITQSAGYSVELIFPTSRFNDPNSILVLKPSTWLKSLTIHESTWKSFKTYEIGAYFAEFESQRYMPRHQLTELLNQYDLIQVVSGSPALAYVTRDAKPPVCLFAATMIQLERIPVLRKMNFLRRVYGYLNLPLVSAFDRRALGIVNHVFAETLYTQQAIAPYISADKISIDTIGVDTERFKPVLSRTDEYILSTGRFADPRKNVPMLFRAYALLHHKMPNPPRLVLAGMNGPTESDWTLAHALGIRDFIDFKHQVPLDELVSLYQNAAFFVLSSHEEGLGIVLLEALACATPVISTRCGGPDSIISDDLGFLIDVNDVENMADKMLWMLTHPSQRRHMGEEGRQMIERRFSNVVVGQKYLDVYDRLIKS